MKKRISLLLVCILIMTVFLTACGGDSKKPVDTEEDKQGEGKEVEQKEGEEEEDDNKEDITLRFSWWGGDERHEATLEAIKKYEELNDNVTIKAEYSGWDGHQEKITTQLSGGTAPDIMQINWNWLTIFSKDGEGFYDLNNVSSEVGLENFSDDILEFGTVNGKLNGIPISLTGRCLYYNKTTYDKFGVEPPKTWDDFYTVAEKFNEEGYYPLDLDSYSAWILAIVYVEQQTGKPFLDDEGNLIFTEEDIKEGLQLYKDFMDKGVIPGAKERAGEGGDIPLHELPNWIEGKYAGVFEWTSSVGKYAQPLEEKDQELILGELPMLDDAKSNGWVVKPSMLFAINKDTEYPEEAAKFINFMLNEPEGAKILGTTRGVPVSESGLKALEEEGLEGLEYEGTKLVLENMGLGFGPYFEHTLLKDIYEDTIDKLGFGELDVDAAAKHMYESVSEALEEKLEE